MFWSNFTNPKSTYIKKYLFEILKEKYAQNENIIERMTSQLVLDSDAQAFVKFIGDIFENGYLIASDQHREALSKMGMKINVTNASQENKIFNQSEKSG